MFDDFHWRSRYDLMFNAFASYEPGKYSNPPPVFIYI